MFANELTEENAWEIIESAKVVCNVKIEYTRKIQSKEGLKWELTVTPLKFAVQRTSD